MEQDHVLQECQHFEAGEHYQLLNTKDEFLIENYTVPLFHEKGFVSGFFVKKAFL